MATIKHSLRNFRVNHGRSSKDIAKTLGIAESTLRSYENGSREISGDLAKKIEEKLGIDRADLRPDLFRREPKRKPSDRRLVA
jgi:transcriptional regulator with XRE-family HTH domain